MISFEIPGAPQGKARARTTWHGTYTPEKTVLYENLVKMCYQNISNYISDKPIEMLITASYEVPKSTSKKNAAQMLLGKIRPTKKPDIDNIAKVILDALNGIAYKDDTQVIMLCVKKKYDAIPRVNVLINEVGD